MPPKTITKSSINCLKFGELLLDENRKMIFLCSYCADITEIENIREHLKNCYRVGHIFKHQPSEKLKCNTDETKLLTKIKKDTKEFLIYGFNKKPPKIDSKKTDLTNLLNIEACLNDPIWYTDTLPSIEDKTTVKNAATSYNDLIEEVTPFVHFKENLKSSTPLRVTRESCKQAAQNQQIQCKSVVKDSETTKQAIISPIKSTLNDVKSKTLDISKKSVQKRPQNISENTKIIVQKPIMKLPTKIVEHDGISTTTTAPAATQRIQLKRKCENSSSTSKVADNNDKNQNQDMGKRRKTIASHLQSSLQQKPTNPPQPTAKIKEDSKKITIRESAIALPIQKTIEKAILNEKTKEPLQKSRSESLCIKYEPQSQSQPQPQSQSQPQPQQQPFKVNTNPKQLQQSLTSTATTTSAKNQILLTKSTNILPLQRIQQQKIAPQTPSMNLQQTIASTTNSNQKTVEILNKLQTLGLKVQRTNPPQTEMNLKTDSSPSSKSNEKALEIIKKLQSKGMNVKLVQKSSKKEPTTTPLILTTIHTKTPSLQFDGGNAYNKITFPSLIKTVDLDSATPSKSNFNKNISIKKCN